VRVLAQRVFRSSRPPNSSLSSTSRPRRPSPRGEGDHDCLSNPGDYRCRCYRRTCRCARPSVGRCRHAVPPRLAGRHHRNPTNQSADFSDGRWRLAVFDLAKSLIRWSPIGDYTASPLSLPDRWDGGSGSSRPRRPLELSSGDSSSPGVRRCGRTRNSRL
jgi:hypothetical protein